jgi:hypothetical protein
MADELTLFDPPEPERRPRVARSEQGRAGMTYTRSVTADIQLRHRPALCQAAVRVFDAAPVLVIGEVDDAEDHQETRRQLGRDWLAALRWLIDPTAGLSPLVEADAVRMPATYLHVNPTGPTACRTRSTVTVKLRDVATLHQLALDACPPDNTTARTEIATSVAAAWHWAAEPYAPLRRIPGIAWIPVDVTVHHLPARSRYSR